MMTEGEFAIRFAAIESERGGRKTRSKEDIAALAMLIHGSGIGSREMAQCIKLSTHHIARLRRYGRFLSFVNDNYGRDQQLLSRSHGEEGFYRRWLKTPATNNRMLTEGADEQERFLAVMEQLIISRHRHPVRITRAKRAPSPKLIEEWRPKLRPMIRDLVRECRKDFVTISISHILALANRIEHVLESMPE